MTNHPEQPKKQAAGAVSRAACRESDIVIGSTLTVRAGGVDAGVPFYDHIRAGRYASFDLTVRATGDIVEIEVHHTIEDGNRAGHRLAGRALGDKGHPPV